MPSKSAPVRSDLPAVLKRAARSRLPFTDTDVENLIESSLEERLSRRLGALAEIGGEPWLGVPPAPDGPMPRKSAWQPPSPKARAGVVKVVRGAWVAKYDPVRAIRERALPASERTVQNSDVFCDYSWADPNTALREPWIHSWLMRGAGAGIAAMDVGDLVFAVRSDWLTSDPTWLRRRAVIGVSWVESTATWPERGSDGKIRWYSEAATFPVRRFNFPVPVLATGDVDAEFYSVRAFRDRSRKALIELNADEALALARLSGLPREILSEPDPHQLAPMAAALDLGPPTMVRRRILEGARAHAHRSMVEKAARDLVVAQLRRARMGVVSTEAQRGLGSDLWARAIESDGSLTQMRIEVKGLSGADWRRARLTKSEVTAARRDAAAGAGEWWLAIVTRALRDDRTTHWLSSSEVVSMFNVEHSDGAFSPGTSSAARREM